MEAEASYLVHLKIKGSDNTGKHISLEWILPFNQTTDVNESCIDIRNKIVLNNDIINIADSKKEGVSMLKENLRGLVELQINKEERT